MDFQSLSYFQNLKKADLSGKPDPYVLVNLANGGVKEMKTETIKNNPNPVWNETFRFNVSHTECWGMIVQKFLLIKLARRFPLT